MFRFIKKFSNLVLIFVAALCVFSATQISASDNTKTYDFDTLTSLEKVSTLFDENENVSYYKGEYYNGQIKLGSNKASGNIEIDYGENGISCSSVNVVVSSYNGSGIVKLTVNDTISGEITLTGSDNETLSVDVSDIVSKIKIETMAKPNRRAYLHQLNLVQAPLTKMYDVNYFENAPSQAAAAVENMPMSVQVEEGGLLAAPTTNPSLAGYVFNGWFTDSACTNQYDFNSKVVANLDLYASWTKDESKVNVIFDGTDTVVSVDINTACSKENAPTGPVVAGKVFKYWSDTNSADATEFDWTQTLASTITLYPVYRDMTANELAGEAFAALSTKAQLKVNYKYDRVDTSLTATLNYASDSLVGENLPGSTLGLDENFVFTTTKGTENVAWNSSSTQIRIYQKSGSNVGSLTITAKSKDIKIKNNTSAVKDIDGKDCTKYGETSDGFAYVKFYSTGTDKEHNRVYIKNGTVLFEYVTKKEKIKDTHTSLCFGSNEITQEMYEAASEFGVLYTTTTGVDFASITDIAALPEGVSSKTMTFVPQGNHYQARACFTFNQDGVDCCEQYATEIHACVYAIIGDKLYMMGDQTFSVNSLAKNYVDKHGDNTSVQKHHGMLEALETMHGNKQN